MPSCVSFSRNKTQRVGLQALNDYEAEKKSAVLSWKKKKAMLLLSSNVVWAVMLNM